jgi:hypothetical protein
MALVGSSGIAFALWVPRPFWGPAMLMIMHIEGSDMTVTLKLEGRLLEPWLGELQTVCESFKVPPDRVHLDLRTLTYVDLAGARFLDRLIRDGARVIACSGFIAELLQIARR